MSSPMDYHSPSSLKHKIRSTICFSCCFRSSTVDLEDDDRPPPVIRSKAHALPEIKEKCRNLISRVGHHRRRGQSADFRYDPLSYALNFDEGNGDDLDFVEEDEFRHRNFSSRLPASPPKAHREAVAAAVGVACS